MTSFDRDIGFSVAIWVLGLTIAVPVTTLLYLKAGASERWSSSLLMAACAGLFFYGLFIYTLDIPFSEGLLFRWLGSGTR